MKLKDINAEITFELWVKPELAGESIELGVGYIDPDNKSKNAYKLRRNGKQWKVLLREASSGINLNFHLKRGCAHLAEIVQVAKDGSALMKVIFFNGEIVEIGDIEIGIDEHIKSTAKRSGIRFNGADALGEVLNEKCKITVGNNSYFVMLAGKSANEDFDTETYDDENTEQIEEKYRSFSIYGERIRIPVQKKQLSQFEVIFFASKIIFRDQQKSEGAIRLARGSIKFTSLPERIKALAAGAMSQLTKETGSYLKQWDDYGAIEGEMLLSRAKAVGRIDYHSTEQTTKGVKFFVSFLPDQLSEGDEIEVTSEEPQYLRKPDITWEEYSKALEDEFATKKEQKKNDGDKSSDSDYAQILNLSKTSIELALPLIPSEQRFLILSINGDKIQIERRMKARAAILEGRSANPLLGLLIEEGGTLPNIQRVTKLKPLTPFVKGKIFKHPPTDKQVEAIEVALNTPDIALIQGPPGTGKTTVVTAILERLNEEYDKTKSIRGQILVSGFQHDAVENIVSRLSVNALPAIKFGKRSTDSEFTEDAVTEKINKWCSRIAENIRKKNPQISQTENQVRLAELFVAYSLCPSKNNTVNLMKRILDLPRSVISEEISTEAEDIVNSLRSEFKPDDPHALRLVRALRISEAAFEDDGPARAIELLDKLEDQLSSSGAGVLEKAGRFCNGKPLNFLPELKALKETLLSVYMPSPDFRTEKPREDVLKLVAKVSKLLEKSLKSTNKRDAILAEFLHELEDNPDGVRESIEDYNFVFAATTQQAAGKAIAMSKNKFKRYDEDKTVKYDTVIIDEAARTSPRDLLIPMSQAEKRIILVGDHRQLPHLIDEEVARVLEGDDSSNSKVDFVKKSMFEYLFRRLKKLEEQDGIKRTVTLDAQYRTHPLLGNFASDNFYAQHNEAYRSPLPADLFKQSLHDIAEKSVVWIDVSNSSGKEGKTGYSRKRVAEAQKIAERLNTWIKSDEGKEFTFGIISFYKAQVFEVYRELQQFDITEKASDGSWQIAEEFRFLENGEERLRIGTVDAFQGMEFDIVFLSIVRTQEFKRLNSWINKENDYERVKQGVFGHLMSENRLCVSMSRQKKVLAIVGDGGLINTQIAVDAVPALKNFYDLCNEQGVIL